MSSVMLNIGPTDDPTYRYKMPKLITKIEGRGNGIKTVCVNMVDVAEALNRDPSLPTKARACACVPVQCGVRS
jgi:translation initiation factor 5